MALSIPFLFPYNLTSGEAVRQRKMIKERWTLLKIKNSLIESPCACLLPSFLIKSPGSKEKTGGVSFLLAGIFVFVFNGPLFAGDTIFSVAQKTRPLIIAHRGGAFIYPENTLYAFSKAAETGVDVLEMDVRKSADGIPVVIHDETVDRTTNSSGLVSSFTLSELSALDAAWNFSPPEKPDFYPCRDQGHGVVSLREVLESFPGKPMIIEIKELDEDLTTDVIRLIREYGRESLTLLGSFNEETLLYIRKVEPAILTHASVKEAVLFVTLSIFFMEGLVSPKYEALILPMRKGPMAWITPRIIKAAERRGVFLMFWDMNDPKVIEAFASKGLKGIMTDRPDLALEILRP